MARTRDVARKSTGGVVKKSGKSSGAAGVKTVAELKVLAKERGIKLSSKDKKADIIEKIRAHAAEAPVSPEEKKTKPVAKKVAKKSKTAVKKTKAPAVKLRTSPKEKEEESPYVSPSSPKKSSPKKVSKKVASKKTLPKGVTIYLLFKTNEFGNSDDWAYELDYAFRGAYKRKEDALKSFVDTILELGDGTESEFFDASGEMLPSVEDTLEQYSWKLMEETLH